MPSCHRRSLTTPACAAAGPRGRPAHAKRAVPWSRGASRHGAAARSRRGGGAAGGLADGRSRTANKRSPSRRGRRLPAADGRSRNLPVVSVVASARICRSTSTLNRSRRAVARRCASRLASVTAAAGLCRAHQPKPSDPSAAETRLRHCRRCAPRPTNTRHRAGSSAAGSSCLRSGCAAKNRAAHASPSPQDHQPSALDQRQAPRARTSGDRSRRSTLPQRWQVGCGSR